MYLQARLKSGKTVHFEINKAKLTVGRGSQADFIIEDDSISRIHCEVTQENNNFFIADLGSSNGTFINEQKLTPNKKEPFNSFFPAILGFHIELRLLDDVKAANPLKV
jgi:pSer/pThr/pTyr-binding forkhead associated (FHA) protein